MNSIEKICYKQTYLAACPAEQTDQSKVSSQGETTAQPDLQALFSSALSASFFYGITEKWVQSKRETYQVQLLSTT